MAKSIKRNALASTALKILNIIFPIIVGPYLARTLSVVDYGEFNRAASFVSWCIPFATFGIYNYGIRQISQIKKDKEKLSYVFSSLFCMGCISCLITSIVFIIYVFTSVNEASRLLYLISGLQIFAQFLYIEWMNEAFENYGFILAKTFIIRLFNLIAVFLFVKKPDDIIAYALIISLVSIANYAVSFAYIKKNVKFKRIHFSDLKHYFSPLIAMLLLTNANMLYTALDRMFLSFQPDGKLVSYYMFASTITVLITQVINSIVIVTMPRLSNYLGENRKEEYFDLLKKSSNSFFFLGIPLCIGLACFSDAAMFLYGGDKYLGASLTLSVFSIRTLLWLCDQSLAYQVIFINGFEKELTKIYFVCGALNVLLNSVLFFSGIYSPPLYVLTTMISEFFVVGSEIYIIRNRISNKAVTISLNYFKYLLVAIIFIPISLIGKSALGFEYSISLVFLCKTMFLVILCALSYFMILYVLKDDIVFRGGKNLISHIKTNRRGGVK